MRTRLFFDLFNDREPSPAEEPIIRVPCYLWDAHERTIYAHKCTKTWNRKYHKHWKREPRAPLIGVSAFFLLSLLLLSFSSLKHLPITYVAMMTASVHNSTQCAHNNEIERRKHRVKRNNTTATTKWQRPCKSPSRWPLYTYARKIYFGPDELRSALSGKISSDFVNFALRTNQSECVSDLWGRAPRCATYIYNRRINSLSKIDWLILVSEPGLRRHLHLSAMLSRGKPHF